MIGICGACGAIDIVIDDDEYCENCHNEYMYRAAQEKAQRDEEIRIALEYFKSN